MGTKLIYKGPEGQSSIAVARHSGESSLLEPGKVYELPHEIAVSLARSSAGWEHVTDYEKLSAKELQSAAAAADIDGRTKLSREELIAALRGDPSPATSDTTGGSA